MPTNQFENEMGFIEDDWMKYESDFDTHDIFRDEDEDGNFMEGDFSNYNEFRD